MAPPVDVQQNACSVQDTMEAHAAFSQVHGGGSELQSPQSVLVDHLQEAFRNLDLKETKSWGEVLKFTKVFKEKRLVFGHQQDTVGTIVLGLFDKQMSQATVCRFENGSLSLKNMYSIKPFMEKYIMAAEQNPEIIEVILKKKSWKVKKQTTISPEARAKLVKCHTLQKKPDVHQILKISKQNDHPKGMMQTWLFNRRKNEKKLKLKDRKTHVLTLPMVSQHVPGPYDLPCGYMRLLMDSSGLQATTEPNAIMYNHPDARMNLYSHGPV